MSVCGTVFARLELRGFSWELGIHHFAPKKGARHHASVLTALRICLQDPPTRLNRHPTAGRCSLLRPPIASSKGTGILTCFPSTTHFCLALGADSPCSDERGAGNLGLTASGHFTRFNATHVSIRTSDTSSSRYQPPSQAYGTLSYHGKWGQSRFS